MLSLFNDDGDFNWIEYLSLFQRGNGGVLVVKFIVDFI